MELPPFPSIVPDALDLLPEHALPLAPFLGLEPEFFHLQQEGDPGHGLPPTLDQLAPAVCPPGLPREPGPLRTAVPASEVA